MRLLQSNAVQGREPISQAAKEEGRAGEAVCAALRRRVIARVEQSACGAAEPIGAGAGKERCDERGARSTAWVGEGGHGRQGGADETGEGHATHTTIP